MLMKKFVYSLAVILPAIMLISSSDALAQRKNTTEKDVVPAYAAEQDYQYGGSNEPMQKKMHKKMHNKHHKENSKKLDCGCDNGAKDGCKCPKGRKCDSGCMKNRMNEKTKDINEEYNTAIKKIDKSGFTQEQKELLVKQARENRDLAMEQMKARSDMRQRHMDARMKMNMQEMMGEKANRKAVKAVGKIH